MSMLDDHVVAVAGGGGGLGLMTVRALLEQGACVVANYRTSGQSLAELKERYPDRLHPVPGDVSDEATAVSLADRARELGHLDALVYNAGISRDGPLISMPVDDWEAVLSVNLLGAFLCTKHALRAMIRRRQGRIIYVSSLAAVVGNAGQANYAASKGALHGLSNAVAQEYSSRGIRSVVVAPGLLDTGIATKLPPHLHAVKAERQLFGAVEAASIASTIAFLASPQAHCINATVIQADGGIKY